MTNDPGGGGVQIEVYSHAEVGEILCSPESCADVTLLLSLSDPEDPPPTGYDNVPDKVRLLFLDADDESGPSEADVRRIIEIARSLANRTGRVLIHCWAGVSRSSAAAIILQSVMLGPGRESAAVASVIAQRSVARPNRRMIAFADRLLEREGRLVDAVAAVFRGI